jgi:3-oxoacyl-[acyl-carrier-protein] synthase II
MRRVALVATSEVTGLGDGLSDLWDGLMAGRSAVAPVTRFPTRNYLTNLGVVLPWLRKPDGGTALLPLLSKLASDFGDVPPGTRLLMASTKVGIDILEEQVRRGMQTDLRRAGEHYALELAQACWGVEDPRALNYNAACASSTIATGRAAAMIARGEAESVLVVCADLLSEFVFSGFSALQALGTRGARPFDLHRNGLVLGEGGAALLLMSRSMATERARPILAELVGWGCANDASHLTAPAQDGSGLVATIRQALAMAGIDAQEVAAVSAHGTATVFNDAMELTALRQIFGGRSVPGNSVKGAIGHTLGAAGGIEVSLGARMLERGLVPPTVGLEHPDDGAEQFFSPEPQELTGRYVLSTSSGFGGVNAAIVLGGAA